MNELPRPPVPTTPATQTEAPARRRRAWPWLLLLALLGGGGWYAWQRGWLPWVGQPTPAATAPPAGFGPSGGARGRGGIAVPVTAAAAAVDDLPILLDALGTVQASNTITVVPQVAGRITEIAFTEGQEIRAGEVLVRIDPRSYQAALDQAVATKAQREAQLANARLDLQRYTQLVRANGASQQQLDTQRAAVAQLEAQVQFDQATIDNAQVQLEHTTIRAPFDGRVGLRQVDVGNLVQSSSSGIVTVTQIRPISVTFTLPQQALPQVMQAIAAGPVQVEARLPDPGIPRVDATPPAPNPIGMLVTIDNQVDAATGTLRLKATFPNDDQRLWPGAFVNVRLQVALLRGVTTIPLVAVQRGPDGAFAFVVQPDNTVRQRPLTLGVVSGTQAMVRSGLRPGEQVVTSGALRLTDGVPVQVAAPVVPPASQPQRRRPPGQGAGQGQRPGTGEARPEGAPPAGSRPDGARREGARPAAAAPPAEAPPGAASPR
ncbi:efflux RND transporter periplasmic adaptor subunit [Roseomonas sp. CECT 9278]|uniref:efflux RND transporter periplasmic adaptor subunit n=1 Tax=Roseomonas sp. CECT 9278 TaxID=2845823 RepID=UPI001E60F9AC|nr:efflux RND transporter periplasmic adaptor subunit [Roseomonas sp. CECT 9278]CAH0190839.1 Multidrug resistance protein MdtA [Roseomonas sp. CECT 9278]